MWSSHYTYLSLMLLTLAGPLLLSFDKKVRYYTQWKFLPIPFLVTSVYFIAWDAMFTKNGIWSFNDAYILGYKLIYLPLEEWLFFICVPFSCIFIYEAANYYIKKDILGKQAYVINLAILLFISITGIFCYDKTYTAFNFISAAVLLAFIQFYLKPKWLGRFYVGYFFSLIPFFMVNGVLTSLPVVRYNNEENLGIRLWTIPVEDTIYCLLLLLMNITIYEGLKAKRAHRAKRSLH